MTTQPDQIRHDIETARPGLGDTVEALAAKAASRPRSTVTHITPGSAAAAAEQVTHAGKENPVPVAILDA